MDLVLVAVVGVVIWLSIVVVAIALCRAASRAEAPSDATAIDVTAVPRSDVPLGHARIPAL